MKYSRTKGDKHYFLWSMTLSGNQGVRVSINEKRQAKETSLICLMQADAMCFEEGHEDDQLAGAPLP